MGEERFLIVNADDFGLSDGVNRGIIEAFERGIVTSTSLMVRWPSAKEAAEYARARPDLSVGLHVDLGEWANREGEWVCLYEVVHPGNAALVQDELYLQLSRFEELTGRLPTHLDSHQHLHLDSPLRGLMEDLAGGLSLPLRHVSDHIRYDGRFYGQARRGDPYPEGVRPEALCEVLRSLPPGITELACHPGAACDHESQYAGERLAEVAALVDPSVRRVVEEEGIRLVGFHALPAAV
jgi:predicted glycoside hydrolase/deacetylase ChbG (UPF0249 family)